MKTHLILIGLVIFFIGCQRTTIDKSFTINFDMQDTTRQEIVIDYTKNIGLSGVTKYIPVKSKDSTQLRIDSIKHPFPAYVNIDEIQFPIWIEPNSNLNIVFSKDTIIFSGKSKIYADYYSKSRKYWASIYNGYEKRNPVLEGRPEGENYFKVQDSITFDRINFLETFFKSTDPDLTRDFVTYEKNNLKYTDIFYKISGLTSIDEFQFYQQRMKLEPDKFLKYTDQFDFNNPELFRLDQYRRCIHWMPNKYIKGNKLDFIDGKEEAYDFIVSLSQNEICKKYIEIVIINDLIRMDLGSSDFELRPLIEKKITQLAKNKDGIEYYLEILQQKLVELKDIEQKSKKDISLFEINNSADSTMLRDFSSNKDVDLLRTIINENPGKVLYIDFWAPWCGPCMQEMYSSSLLHQKYENKNIEFIFLGIFCKRDNWESTIKRRNIKGEHYFLSDQQAEDLQKLFNFQSIPRYLIIDKNGIVKHTNAPRPSEMDKLDTIFEELLK